jgi:hypothetical protein
VGDGSTLSNVGVDGIVSTANATAITIDSNENVGIGTSSPSGKIHIQTASSGGTVNTATDELVLEGSSDIGIQFLSSTTGNARLLFGDSGANNIGQIKYAHNDNSMYFYANSGEKLRILGSGGITFNGDTSDSNALDDYEEGTWTPSVTASNGGSSMTYSSQVGRYTKIGNLVYINGMFAFSNKGNLQSGTIKIKGIPFNQTTDAPQGLGGLITEIGGITIAVTNPILINGGTDNFYVNAYWEPTTGNYNVSLNGTQVTDSFNLRFECQYRTDA